MVKKKFNETKFGTFLNKASKFIPEVLTVGGEILTGDVGGAVEKIGDILKSKAQDDTRARDLLIEFERYKLEFTREIFNLEIQDRNSARELYKTDDIAQKILAGVFTLAYFLVSYSLINHFFSDSSRLEDYELGFMSTLFGAMSSKVNTIIDFFFGGSVKE